MTSYTKLVENMIGEKLGKSQLSTRGTAANIMEAHTRGRPSGAAARKEKIKGTLDEALGEALSVINTLADHEVQGYIAQLPRQLAEDLMQRHAQYINERIDLLAPRTPRVVPCLEVDALASFISSNAAH